MPDHEAKWQQVWKEKKIFEPTADNREKFFGTVPYPYANSALHIGHGRSFTNADIFVRYQRVLGKNVMFPMGFHISGTPVLAVADGIKRGDQKQIELTRQAIAEYVDDVQEQERLLKSFTDPFAIADFFSSKIEQTFDSIGLSVDWTRQFTTGDLGYQKFVQWQYRKLNDAGILVQGKYPILYDVVDANAVGEDDIKDGDTEKVSVQEMKYICFKFSDSDEYLVAATLRPDSLFGATNVFVKPDMNLVKLRVEDRVWIVSKASQIKIQHQFDSVELISEHKGEEFLDRRVVVPLLNREVPVYPMSYPDENHGTGIVYSSPADSPHDYMYLFELKFPGRSLDEFDADPLELTPITKTKDKKGNEIKYKSNIPAFDKLLKYKIYQVDGNADLLERAKEELYKEAHYGAVMINCGEYDGTPLKNNVGAQKVKEALEGSGVGGTYYETSRRAFTRSGNQVIVASLDGQWFLDYSSPEVKQKAYDLLEDMEYLPENLKQTQRGYLSWVQKRPCARKRGLGTPLPFDEQWVIEPLSDSTIYPLYYLISKYIESGELNAELDDAFFDYVFGMSEESQGEVSDKIRSDVDYWKSFDFRYTAPPHMSNHLSFLIYHFALIFDKKLHPRNITVGGLLIKDGEKISKSKGNGIPLIQVREKFGADLYRLYVAVAASFEAEMDFREEEVAQLEKKFARWQSLMIEAKKVDKPEYGSLNALERWLVASFYKRVESYFTHMNEFKFREAFIQILYEFLGDIAYFQRQDHDVFKALSFVYDDYITLMTPVVPHICEELNRLDSLASVQSYTTDSQPFTNPEVLVEQDIIGHVLASIEQFRNKQPEFSKITLVQAADTRFELFDKLSELLAKTNDFREVMQALSSFDDKKFIQKFVPKTLTDGVHAYMSKQEERSVLEQSKAFISKEFGVQVEITDEQSSALPARPMVKLS